MIIHDVEQGSEAWLKCRLGIPTASEFSRLVTSKGERSKSLEPYAGELAAELFAGKPLEGFDGVWLNRGKELEAEACDLYAFTTDANVQRVGFITLDDATAGCSPDALVNDDGGLEVKCLKIERHVAAVHYHQKHGRCPTDYVMQVQGCLWVTGRKWWNLCFYNPDMPPLIIRQTPDLAMHAAIADGVRAVIAERDAQLVSLRRQQTHIPE